MKNKLYLIPTLIFTAIIMASCDTATTPVEGSDNTVESSTNGINEKYDADEDEKVDIESNSEFVSNIDEEMEEEISFFEYIESSQLKIEECENDNIDVTSYYYGDGLCPYQDKASGLWGYIDESMNTAIEPVYFEVYPFYEGLAGVYDGYNWGFINTSGNYVFEPQFYKIVPFEPHHPGFLGGMAIVEDAQNSLLPTWAPNSEKNYHIIDKEGNDTLIDHETYMDKFFEIKFCNGIFCVNELGEDIRLLNSDGTVNHELSAKFQPIVAAEKYSRCSLLRIDGNYTDNLLVWSYDRMFSLMRISDTNGNLMFDLSALREFDQIKGIQVCSNVFITKRKINDIEQSAVYNYSGEAIIDYKYKNIIPICKNGTAVYFICFGHDSSFGPIVLDNEANEIEEYIYIDFMKSFDGKDYLLCVNKDDPHTADITEFPSGKIITSIKCDENLISGTKTYSYVGIYNGVILISRNNTYVFDEMKVINEEIEADDIFLDKGVCRSFSVRDYYKITGFPLDENNNSD